MFQVTLSLTKNSSKIIRSVEAEVQLYFGLQMGEVL